LNRFWSYNTIKVSVQFCPARDSAKLAVPVEAGVPEITYVITPAPVAKFPANNVAVNPVTPAEAIACPE
jgi:hypothetical protein